MSTAYAYEFPTATTVRLTAHRSQLVRVEEAIKTRAKAGYLDTIYGGTILSTVHTILQQNGYRIEFNGQRDTKISWGDAPLNGGGFSSEGVYSFTASE